MHNTDTVSSLHISSHTGEPREAGINYHRICRVLIFLHHWPLIKLKVVMISNTIVFLILAITVAAYHGYQLQPCSLSAVSSFAFSHLSRLGPIRNIRLYSAIGGESISADTVVARCTKKIVDSLNPKECSVTSTDDDPNGSHVSC